MESGAIITKSLKRHANASVDYSNISFVFKTSIINCKKLSLFEIINKSVREPLTPGLYMLQKTKDAREVETRYLLMRSLQLSARL